jgi:GTP-binding protein
VNEVPGPLGFARGPEEQSLKVIEARFLKSASSRGHWPKTDFPEIAFAGRSNVGKSSAINQLLGRKNLVKISKTPGHTRTLNFFKVNEQLLFVDLPGYGYAKVPLSVKEKWGPMIESYLLERDQLTGVVLILDSRIGPTDDDMTLADFLSARGLPMVAAATKSDKLKASGLGRNRMMIKEKLGPEIPLIMFSSTHGRGKNELWKEIKNFIHNTRRVKNADPE